MASTSYYGGGRLNFTGGGGENTTGGGLIYDAIKRRAQRIIAEHPEKYIVKGGSTSYYGGNSTGGSSSYYGGKKGGKTAGTSNPGFMAWVNWKKENYPGGGYKKAEISKAWAAHKKKMGIKTKK